MTEQLQKTLTVGEVLSDGRFINHVKKLLADLKKERRNRPLPKPGFKYKRDWYDRMDGKGMLSSQFFLDNIESIWSKQSDLPSIERNIIAFVCNKAFSLTVQHYTKK